MHGQLDFNEESDKSPDDVTAGETKPSGGGAAKCGGSVPSWRAVTTIVDSSNKVAKVC